MWELCCLPLATGYWQLLRLPQPARSYGTVMWMTYEKTCCGEASSQAFTVMRCTPAAIGSEVSSELDVVLNCTTPST